LKIYRNATPADAVKLAAISVEVWLNTYAKTGISNVYAEYVLQRFTPRYFGQMIAEDKKQIIIAETDNYLLGYIAIDYHSAMPESLQDLTAAEIATLYVRARHAGCGIGSALLQQARAAVSARNIRHIWLSVLHDNHPALNFYSQQGFIRQGTIWFELSGERHENYVLTHPVLPV
jgi:ribosomal protein S18 acetylase RimI-like enzyme